MDPKLLEAWLRLTADALKGTEEARKTLETLGVTPPSREALARWAAAWLPQYGERREPPQGGELQEIAEQWWKALGVVPRHRYLELLERYEELRVRLEEAEKTIRNLRDVLARRGSDSEAGSELLDQWEETTRKVLEAQSEWAKSWAEGFWKVEDDKGGKKD